MTYENSFDTLSKEDKLDIRHTTNRFGLPLSHLASTELETGPGTA